MTASTSIDLNAKIPNNVGLAHDTKLRRALEKWLPNYLEWWNDMGPTDFADKPVYLRTAISVSNEGWAHYDHVKMPDYRWGIFLNPRNPDESTIRCGDDAGRKAWFEVPGEHRNALRRIIVTQADTEPASVEQQRLLGHTAPSLYDMRNLFQVNVEEGRHLWAMVYLLHKYFGRDGRDEADELLNRRSGDEDKPRILGAFNQPCDHWLSFFAFTMFTDRDGKFQLAALAESGFDPLARSTEFMLTEEAHHLFVGQTGLQRIIQRSAELYKQDPNNDVRNAGGIDFDLIQRTINYWFTYSLDLFGGEVSNNAADFFGAGLKGRFRERKKYEDHKVIAGTYRMPMVEGGSLVDKDIPMRNAMNAVLRDEYITDCERALRKWNKVLEKEEIDIRLTLPSPRFHRHQGIYAGHFFNPAGELITEAEYNANRDKWLLVPADNEYLLSIMKPCYEPGKFANWIAPPTRGIEGRPQEFEYVRL
ncbi:benzoyl-CoA oxygenase component B [Plesiocystis pacifica SIR-1]|uniref:Benzoyl-CoA oxygenase component B n=1 Tax=Plesiocystis pacifica SIR-1 TaxID=391625 RepID=A6G1F6_9BACT|nr:benzoyl-CoA 2,3-epoxidase subunit BoxB [Plesiocystis pacifica]EDM80220.1 benzoyl-CoA oxygenase component B [Plesiocystis pacifica SIR-1]